VRVEPLGLFGEAEVEDLDPAVVAEEEVRRLDVAVDDPLLVGGGEAARDLRAELERLAQAAARPRPRSARAAFALPAAR
jgi:hypothetical protein